MTAQNRSLPPGVPGQTTAPAPSDEDGWDIVVSVADAFGVEVDDAIEALERLSASGYGIAPHD